MNDDIKAIVFDVGGVLRNSSKTFDFTFRKVFEEFGLNYSFSTIDVWHLRGFRDWNPRRGALRALLCVSRSKTDLSEIMKMPDAEELIAGLIKSHVKPGDDELIEKMAARYVFWFYENTESRKYTKIMPHAAEAVEELSKKYTLAILTDSRLSLTDDWLKAIGIRKYFNCLIGGEQLKNKKPNPKGLFLISEKLMMAPNQILYVGDSAHDIIAAKNAGCKSAAILTGMGMKHVLEKEKPDFIFENLAELAEVSSDR
ncbi:HAD family hydrolase [archaeon]|nr:HAD family hydrolase [Nanoarchaeota archaeon]MBU4300106.1 HAD family hydrolase [Nanoarchaeota archaeon]MBU4452308.1 HAD family hydrolase [Nanoarchaeota archaeon]MCG2723834.1 HAD family hydrolase [archaeon]